MTTALLWVLNMGLVGTYAILLVLLLRPLIRQVSKAAVCWLWLIPLLRLLCPFSLESPFSLLWVKPRAVPMDIEYAEIPQIDSGVALLDQAVNRYLPPADPYASVNPVQILLFLAAICWAAGVAVLLASALVSTLRLAVRLRDARSMGGGVWESGRIPTPFVFGLVRPRVYLPAGLEEESREMVLLHERAHIRRRDHLLKPLAYLALCLHWFNPLVWLSFRLMGRDMELACDERVLREMEGGRRRRYAYTLLHLSSGRRTMRSASPLAFGESDVKGRIRSVLGYRRSAGWAAVVALLAVALLAAGLLLNPLSMRPSYYRFTFLDVRPADIAHVDDVFFEITREGDPELLVELYITQMLYAMMEPPDSYGHSLEKVESREELQAQYARSLEEGRVADYVLLDGVEREVEAEYVPSEASEPFDSEGPVVEYLPGLDHFPEVLPVSENL